MVVKGCMGIFPSNLTFPVLLKKSTIMGYIYIQAGSFLLFLDTLQCYTGRPEN